MIRYGSSDVTVPFGVWMNAVDVPFLMVSCKVQQIDHLDAEVFGRFLDDVRQDIVYDILVDMKSDLACLIRETLRWDHKDDSWMIVQGHVYLQEFLQLRSVVFFIPVLRLGIILSQHHQIDVRLQIQSMRIKRAADIRTVAFLLQGTSADAAIHDVIILAQFSFR